MPQSPPMPPALAAASAPRAAAHARRTGRGRLLRALVTALLLAMMVLVAPASSWAAPEAEDFAGSPESLRLDSLGPVALAPGGMLSAEITITNTSSASLEEPSLELRTRTPRVTARSLLEEWSAATEADTRGEALATSTRAPTLAPGESAQVRVRVPASTLGYSTSPDLWGARRLSFTLVSEDTPLSSLRTFAVWRPPGVTSDIDHSVLVPVAAPDPAAVVRDPEGFATEATEGDLAHLTEIALLDGVDWVLDPSLLSPPPTRTVAEGAAEEGDDAAAPATAPVEGTGLVPEQEPAAAALNASLQEGAGGRTLLASPYAGSDLLSLDEQGATGLLDRESEASREAWEDSGITPRSTVVPLASDQATGTEILAARSAGAQSVLVPADAGLHDADAAVTPSSVGVLPGEAGPTPVIAPDPGLSDRLSSLTRDAKDPGRIRQLYLADTATIAAQDVPAERHLVALPEDPASLDPSAVEGLLRDLDEAPWVEDSPTATLLDAAEGDDWTTDAFEEDGGLLTLGEIDPESVAGPEGARPERLDPEVVTDLGHHSARLEELESVMEDPAPVDAPQHLALAATDADLRGDAGTQRALADEVGSRTQELRSGLSVEPASEYNLVSDAAGVPITVRNTLPTPVTVQLVVTADSHVVQIRSPQEVTVPADSTTSVTVPVESVANGRVTLSAGLATTDGDEITEPVQVPLTVNAAWENWTTLAIAIAMGLLVVIGVLRARRHGSDARAPAVRAPEDPVILSRSGRSEPIAVDEDSADPSADGPASATSEEPDPDDPPTREQQR